MKRVKDWWLGLPKADRQMVYGWALVVAAFFFVLLVWPGWDKSPHW